MEPLIEPDVEDVGDLLIVGRVIVVAEEQLLRTGVPGVRAFAERVQDAGIDLRVANRK